jgi:dTDP-glucose 4,6-dehydratase
MDITPNHPFGKAFMQKRVLVMDETGFIGSAVVCHIVEYKEYSVVNVDKLTYAGNLES